MEVVSGTLRIMRVLVPPVTAGDHSPVPVAGLFRSRLAPTALALGVFGLGAAMPAAARAEPPRAPTELMANVAIGPAATLRNLAAYADAAKPGAGAAVAEPIVRAGLAGAVGATSLDGFDPGSWSYLLIASLDGAPALALVSKVSDAKLLAASAGTAQVRSKGGWAIVGPGPMVERLGAYALATLPAQRAPGALTATVYVPHILALFKNQIDAARTQFLATMAGPAAQMAPLMTGYFDGLLSVAADTEKVVVTLEATADLASLDLALVPRPGSRLAKFVAAQRPSNYALLDRLPDMSAAVLFGGHLELGPYSEHLLETMAAFYGPAVSKELLAAMRALTKVMTGELGVAARFAPGSGVVFTQVFGVSDTAAADRAFAAIFALFRGGQTFETMGMSTTIKTNAGTVEHDGVALRSYEASYDLSKASAIDRKAVESMLPRTATRVHVGAFDRLALVAYAPDSLAEAERAIDAARGKAPRFTAPQIVGQLLASSRARKDSVAMMMDLGAIMATVAAAAGGTIRAPSGVQPVVITVGCADRNAHFRIGIPATTARTAVNAGKP
jgi:hypothetical protein